MSRTYSWAGRLLRPTLALLLFLPAVGCGSPHGTVTGKVTVNGQPMDGGYVTFIAAAGGSAGSAPIQKDGTYTAENLPLGDMKVGVEPPKVTVMGGGRRGAAKMVGPPKGVQLPPNMDPKIFNPAANEGKPIKIPEKYTDPNKSGLTVTVTKGTVPFNIDIK